MTDQDRKAIRVAHALLNLEEVITTDAIRAGALEATERVPGSNLDTVITELEMGYDIWIGTGSILDDAREDHLAWLPERKSLIQWNFWRRYESWLTTEEGWPEAVLRGLDEVTDTILERFEDPQRPGFWNRRGMVVGHVQSGKTANYTGVICKAADAGYKLIIVLAGRHNSLRSQTQLRLDEGFLGFDTQTHRAFAKENRWIGVGRLRGERRLPVHSLTDSADLGDFKNQVASRSGISLGGEPVILVVKKNKRILEQLHRWCLSHGDRQPDGRKLVSGIPLLVIDDEADDASINTKEVPLDLDGNPQDDYDVTAINKGIRRLLNGFEQSAYVAYTATPFANIFIDHEARTESLGDDLFPRSFIVNLPAPSNYVGPARVFGLRDDSLLGRGEPSGLDIVREINDWQDWIAEGHKKDDVPGAMPASLLEAIRVFILSCAARHARGQGDRHNSMLIHVTRFTKVQGKVVEQIRDELTFLQRRIRDGDGNAPSNLLAELEALWHREFVPRLESPLPWEAVRDSLLQAVLKIRVKEINGSAKDTLEYWDNRETGLSVIAVGGDKLSRGLTLEGLSVSYYLRAAKMYDTLMQMGRWFGYRPGYLDLCRLYTTAELIDWYAHITLANEELRREFDHMASIGATPRDFGLRVRTHPDGLTVTAANKMRDGTPMSLSYAKTVSETVVFHQNQKVAAENRQAVEDFLLGLGTPTSRSSSDDHLWTGVDVHDVLDLLRRYRVHPDAKKVRSDLLDSYIQQRNQAGELSTWTVALISKGDHSSGTSRIAGLEVGMIERAIQDASSAGKYTIRRLLSPTDEYVDFTKEQRDEALEQTRRAWKPGNGPRARQEPPDRPSGNAAREVRDCHNGLLLLYPLVLVDKELNIRFETTGLAISFPGSNTAHTIEYIVNNVFWDQEFGLTP